MCVCVFFFFGGGARGGGEGGEGVPLTFKRIVEERESPDFRSLEVGILI